MQQTVAMTKQPDWGHLAEAIRLRMAELGLTYRTIGEAGGPSSTTVGDLLKGNPDGANYAPLTIRKLEDVLKWERGAVADVLAGRDPRPIVSTDYRVEVEAVGADAQLLLEIMNGAAKLTEKDQREILALIRAKGR